MSLKNKNLKSNKIKLNYRINNKMLEAKNTNKNNGELKTTIIITHTKAKKITEETTDIRVHTSNSNLTT